jgi:hypothetical protein
MSGNRTVGQGGFTNQPGSPPALTFDPDTDLVGQFATCLEKKGFEEQAEAARHIGRSDRWEDHAHSFKEAARIAAELLSDCLEHFESRSTRNAVAKVKLDISNLYRMSRRLKSVGGRLESGRVIR